MWTKMDILVPKYVVDTFYNETKRNLLNRMLQEIASVFVFHNHSRLAQMEQ